MPPASTRTATTSLVRGRRAAPPARWGDETLRPAPHTALRGHRRGALAEQVVLPRRNLRAEPDGLSFEEPTCLPTAWLTAYRMLFTRGDRGSRGMTVLVRRGGQHRHGGDRAGARGGRARLGDLSR